MRREAMPIVAAGLWLTFTGLSRFPSQPMSSASLGNLKCATPPRCACGSVA
jgi:hypothetical protein